MEKGVIKILGAGISGMSAAINLRKLGYEVKVYDIKNAPGKTTGDYQFLENWVFNKNVLKLIRKMNIQTDFYYAARHSVEIYSSTGNLYIGRSRKPFMYLIKRGTSRDSIDSCFYKQARKLGVKFYFNKTISEQEVDIIATGPKEIFASGYGIKFNLKSPNKEIAILDDSLSKELYSYFSCHKGKAEIVVCNVTGVKDLDSRLKLAIKRFEKILGVKIRGKKEKFSGVVALNLYRKAMIRNKYYLGEAAGFQDGLAGFGMVYAIKSGYYAAMAIAKKKDYDKLWKNDFLDILRISHMNRALFKTLGNEGYDKFVESLSSKEGWLSKILRTKDIRKRLKKIYTKPIAEILFKKFI